MTVGELTALLRLRDPDAKIEVELPSHLCQGRSLKIIRIGSREGVVEIEVDND